MPKLFDRLAKSGVNMLVIIVAIGVFVVAFIALSAIANASRPDTMDVLAASRDLNIGDAIAPIDVITITVYEDRLAGMYVPASEADQVVGGYAALPVFAGQPITRYAIISPAGIGTRLSAVLSQYPGYSLFPLTCPPKTDPTFMLGFREGDRSRCHGR